MKKGIFLITIAISLFFAACSVSQSAGNKGKGNSYDHSLVIFAEPETYSLANLLRQLPGVIVNESMRSTSVYVRGGRPLFVLDGVRLGRNFTDVTDLVNVRDITAIELLRDPGESVIYGPDAQNGVIIIHTEPFELTENQ